MPSAFSEQLRQLPKTVYLCLGALLAMLATALLLQLHSERTLSAQHNSYGQLLANMTAQQAVDATLNRDLVSLQVILSNLTASSGVATATIHDVENRLLVQAGDSPGSDGRSRRHFTAAITLQDSVAGYVTVSTDFTQPGTGSWPTLGAAAAVLLLISALAYRQRQAQQPLPVVAAARVVDEVVALETEYPKQYHSTLLTLYSANLAQLRKQLNAEALKRLLQALEQQLNGVTALYNGELLQLHDHSIQVIFYSNNSRAESSFHAICSALLILGLQGRGDKSVQLRLNAAVTAGEDAEDTFYRRFLSGAQRAQSLRYLRQAAADSVLVEAALLGDGDLAQRLQFQVLADTRELQRVKEIGEPYLSLLEKQRRQLHSL